MSIPGIYVVDMLRQRQIVKMEKARADNHAIARLYTESRWPYTARLSPQQVACMRDSYCGQRINSTALQTRSNYDRIHQPEEGWDQRARLGSRHFLKPLQVSARQEEEHRPVEVCANAAYGKRASQFFDFQSKDNRRICHTKSFNSKTWSLLPNLVDKK